MYAAARTMRIMVAVPAAIALAACQTIPPNTPGAGVGKTYTPIIDMAGVSQTAYMSDLDGCRNSAAMIDAERAQLAGAVAGALAGALVSAAYGTSNRYTQGNIAYGAMAGTAHAGNRAFSKQQLIMGNCMAMRGYRVLDGTSSITYTMAVTPVQAAAPAAAPVIAQPAAATPAQPAVTIAAAAPTPAAAAPTAPAVAPQPPQPVASTSVIARAPTTAPGGGVDSFSAEKLGRSLSCADASISATLVGKGPGYESYSMKCTNGETLLIRCELGNCRALR